MSISYDDNYYTMGTSIRNGFMKLWIVRHIPLLKVCILIHRIVTAKIYLSLCGNVMQTTKTAHYYWSLLKNRNISNKYTIVLKNKFNALPEISETLTLNDEYENFANVYIEAAPECTPTQLRAKQSSMVDISSKQKMKQCENGIPM